MTINVDNNHNVCEDSISVSWTATSGDIDVPCLDVNPVPGDRAGGAAVAVRASSGDHILCAGSTCGQHRGVANGHILMDVKPGDRAGGDGGTLVPVIGNLYTDGAAVAVRASSGDHILCAGSACGQHRGVANGHILMDVKPGDRAGGDGGTLVPVIGNYTDGAAHTQHGHTVNDTAIIATSMGHSDADTHPCTWTSTGSTPLTVSLDSPTVNGKLGNLTTSLAVLHVKLGSGNSEEVSATA